MPYLRGDFELIGLSRDAVLRVHEAFLKAAIMTWAITVIPPDTVRWDQQKPPTYYLGCLA